MNETMDVKAASTAHSTYHSFPTSLEQFKMDPRVHFDRVSNKWALEQEDGQEFEFDDSLNRWIPVLDETDIEKQQAAYAVAGVDENEPANANLQKSKKRKDFTGAGGDEEQIAPKKNKQAQARPEKKNSAVYVTNLPHDVTVKEIESVFSKFGIIAQEIDSQTPRIKLYTDTSTGEFKGEALVSYFRPESVALAIQMLDDTDFRFNASGADAKMKVQVPDYSYKKHEEEVSSFRNGDAPAANHPPRQRSERDKKKIMEKTKLLNSKLADWSDDEVEPRTSKWETTVVLKQMFTLKELEEDPSAMLDIKEDVREECEKLGDITNVTLYDKEKDGVISVKFKSKEAADECVKLMDGRMFDGRRVDAYIFDGLEKFRKSRKAAPGGDAEQEKEEAERLDRFGTWLETEE